MFMVIFSAMRRKLLIIVATYLSTGRRGKKKARSSPREKMSGVATNVYSRKTLEKPKRGLRILKIRVRELFMHGGGISTPCACYKGRQPLIECAQRDFRIIYFILFIFFYIFF